MTNGKNPEQYILACFLIELVASEVWKIMGDAERREIINRVRLAIADGNKGCLIPTLRRSLQQLPFDVINVVFPYFHPREQRALDDVRFGQEVNRRKELRRKMRMAEQS